jgi:hypothetical protein
MRRKSVDYFRGIPHVDEDTIMNENCSAIWQIAYRFIKRFTQEKTPTAPTTMNENRPIIRVIRVNSWLFLED